VIGEGDWRKQSAQAIGASNQDDGSRWEITTMTDNDNQSNPAAPRRALRCISRPDSQTGGHYSPAVVAGDFAFISGQTPRGADRQLIGDTIEAQTAATLDNVVKVLAAAGAGLEDIVKVNIYLSDLTQFGRFNTIYAQYFPHHKPARTTVESGLQGVMIEIDAVAYLGGTRPA
jgi:2-iminobutanoate/2-iminopropanoate deaminase